MTDDRFAALREIWLPIAGYPGYEVSNRGNVIGPRKQLIPHPGRKGYLRVSLYSKDRPQRTISVAKLVMETFVGPRPSGMEIAHLDGDVTNNTLSNLRYCSHAENENHKWTHGRMCALSRHHQAKLSDSDVAEIRLLYSQKANRKWGAIKVAKRFGISPKTISSVVCERTWRGQKNG